MYTEIGRSHEETARVPLSTHRQLVFGSFSPAGFGLVKSTPALSLRVHGMGGEGDPGQPELSSALPLQRRQLVQCSPRWMAPLDPHVLWQSPPGTLCPFPARGSAFVLS